MYIQYFLQIKEMGKASVKIILLTILGEKAKKEIYR